jgi:hypothetical protein
VAGAPFRGEAATGKGDGRLGQDKMGQAKMMVVCCPHKYCAICLRWVHLEPRVIVLVRIVIVAGSFQILAMAEFDRDGVSLRLRECRDVGWARVFDRNFGFDIVSRMECDGLMLSCHLKRHKRLHDWRAPHEFERCTL